MHNNIILIFSGSRVYFEVFGGKIKKNSFVEPHNYYRQVGLFRRYTLSTSSPGIRATHRAIINKQNILMYVGISLSRRLYYDIMLNRRVFRLRYLLLYLRSSITMELIRQRNQFSPYKD